MRTSRNLRISSSCALVLSLRLRIKKSIDNGIFCFGDLCIARSDSISRLFSDAALTENTKRVWISRSLRRRADCSEEIEDGDGIDW